MTFAEHLKSLRITAGNTQIKVAEAVGISINYYQSLEQGRKSPSKRTLKNIADYFHEPVSSFNSPAVNDSLDQAPEIVKEPPKIFTPPAVKGFLFRMSDGYLCTAPKCEWRRRVDENTYYCPLPGKGCMKEGRIK